MKHRVLFVVPPLMSPEGHKEAGAQYIIPAKTVPYGVLSMAAYLKKIMGDEVEIEVFVLGAFVSLAERLREFKPNVVGISALFNTSYSWLGLISRTIIKIRPLAWIVIGGGLATNMGERVLREFPDIDAACFGEGELPMADLLGALGAHNHWTVLHDHQSWMTREKLKSGWIPKPTFIDDLDEIPPLDYSLIDLKGNSGRSLDRRYSSSADKVEVSIHTSRGCPYNCVFCANGTVHGKTVRFMSDRRVDQEVKYLVETTGANVLLIEDDHFFADRERGKRILKLLRKYKLNIEFPNGLAVHSIDEETGRLLKAAGTSTMALAVESGSDHVLKEIIHKPHTTAMIRNAAEILKKNDIIVHAFIVIGLPGETDEHRLETMRLLDEVGFDWVYFFLAVPVAGSRLYSLCLENNYLVGTDFGNHLVNKANIRAPGVDPETIERTVYLMNLEANFVRNYNMRTGNYRRAFLYFSEIAKKYPGHAFAHYFTWRAIVKRDPEWQEYAEHFNLI